MLIALERELSFYHNKLIMVAESGIQRRKVSLMNSNHLSTVWVNLRSRFTIDSSPGQRVDGGGNCLPGI